MARLDQFEGQKYHYAREIDKARLRRLVILGHPASPIYVDPIENRGAPDELLIGARCQMEFETGYTGVKEKRAFVFFGYRYGFDEFMVEIDPAGDCWKVLREKVGQDIDGNPIIAETMRGKL